MLENRNPIILTELMIQYSLKNLLPNLPSYGLFKPKIPNSAVKSHVLTHNLQVELLV